MIDHCLAHCAVELVEALCGRHWCWNHRLLNLLDKLPKCLQAEAKSLLTKIPYAETREAAARQKRAFQTWATKKDVAAGARRARPRLMRTPPPREQTRLATAPH